MDPKELRFRWEDPRPGDRGNFSSLSLGAACVRVGRIRDDQVVARIFRAKGESDLLDRAEYLAVLVFDGGASRYLGRFGRLDMAEENATDYLFGALRDWVTCGTCGVLACVSSTQDGARLRAIGRCFDCQFWYDRVDELAAQPNRNAVVSGKMYTVGDEGAPGSKDGRGFGGQRFHIRWRDGRSLVTTNLWHRGEVPAHFRDRLPDDADFA